MDIRDKIIFAPMIHTIPIKKLNDMFRGHEGNTVETVIIAKTNLTQSDQDFVLYLYSDGTWSI